MSLLSGSSRLTFGIDSLKSCYTAVLLVQQAGFLPSYPRPGSFQHSGNPSLRARLDMPLSCRSADTPQDGTSRSDFSGPTGWLHLPQEQEMLCLPDNCWGALPLSSNQNQPCTPTGSTDVPPYLVERTPFKSKNQSLWFVHASSEIVLYRTPPSTCLNLASSPSPPAPCPDLSPLDLYPRSVVLNLPNAASLYGWPPAIKLLLSILQL